jgi:tetratricopeptide (TPR) repeat protein
MKNDKNWLRRFLDRLGGVAKRGDVIQASVGAGARDVIIGKNIIKVGTLVVPTLPVVASIVLLALAAGFGLWYLLVPAEMPVGELNVAVADFGQVDAQGRVRRSEDGRNLSEWMFRALQKEYESLPDDIDAPLVWHDSMGPTKKRARIGLIGGHTVEEREAAAAAVADRIHANVVIYGNLSPDEDNATFTPEFYIAEVVGEADEIVGPHRLGSPIDLKLPIDPHDQVTGVYLEKYLGSRTDLLTWFTQGLVYDLAGQHEQAFDLFQQAEAEVRNWDDTQGTEVHYYFKGREALFLSRDDPSWLDAAEEAFNQALEINSDYARAHIGLGGVYYQRAQFLPPDLRLETADLDRAILEYTKAMEGGDDSLATQVALKGRLGLGFAYRLQGEAYLHSQIYDQAETAFARAVEYIEAGLPLINEDDHRLLAQTYLALGAGYQQQAHLLLVQEDIPGSRQQFQNARDAYSECLRQVASAKTYDDDLKRLRDDRCQPYQNDVQQALDSLAEG